MRELWKAIPGFEGIYEASTLGNIRRIGVVYKGRKPPYYLKPLQHNHGYLLVSLHKDKRQRTYLIHRLVMLTFKGDSPLTVNHKNGKKTDNRLVNLEYLSLVDNAKHSVENKLHAFGNKIKSSKLNEPDVIKIRELFASGTNYKQIAAMYNIHPTNVYQIAGRKTWRHLP